MLPLTSTLLPTVAFKLTVRLLPVTFPITEILEPTKTAFETVKLFTDALPTLVKTSPTHKLPAMPTPPDTTNAPVVMDVEMLLPFMDKFVSTDAFP